MKDQNPGTGNDNKTVNNSDISNHKSAVSHKSTVSKLVLATFGMFLFGFLLVPLYDVFCQITGLNGKTSNTAYVEKEGFTVDNSRMVTVQFITNTNAGMNWLFEPLQKKVRVHPGELTRVSFSVVNPSLKRMTAQAVPSVSPSEGAEYLLKTQCFCFEQQELNPGASQQMTLLFRVDPQLPDHISTLTLAYTLFDISSTRPVSSIAERSETYSGFPAATDSLFTSQSLLTSHAQTLRLAGGY